MTFGSKNIALDSSIFRWLLVMLLAIQNLPALARLVSDFLVTRWKMEALGIYAFLQTVDVINSHPISLKPVHIPIDLLILYKHKARLMRPTAWLSSGQSVCYSVNGLDFVYY